jgi:hypothetical protein
MQTRTVLGVSALTVAVAFGIAAVGITPGASGQTSPDPNAPRQIPNQNRNCFRRSDAVTCIVLFADGTKCVVAESGVGTAPKTLGLQCNFSAAPLPTSDAKPIAPDQIKVL